MALGASAGVTVAGSWGHGGLGWQGLGGLGEEETGMSGMNLLLERW